MSKNRAGGVYHTNMEWGDKARKEEDRNRGLNNTARKDAIKEQSNDIAFPYQFTDSSWSSLAIHRGVVRPPETWEQDLSEAECFRDL